ncbi:MAG: helix-turn-helix transcriptional regulator [Clostridia bacterium]|nr:helix-turn-helix transcriptional regulator [Clostridia bacterium]
MDPIKTGQLIADARKKLNITQKELAEQLSITDKAVSKWERGLSLPDISILLPLSQILGVNLYELLKGEKINKKELDEVLKNTIIYSTNEIKKHKTKYFRYSLIVVIITILISSILLVNIYRNQESVGGIVDRDTVYSINYYTDYNYDLSEDYYLEVLDLKMPLSWSRKSITVKEEYVSINYSSSFTEIIKAYNDEHYVKLAMTNMSAVLFTLIDDIDFVHIIFEDCKYTVDKNDIKKVFSISDFATLEETENWKNAISKKLTDKEFVNTTFNTIFLKNQ